MSSEIVGATLCGRLPERADTEVRPYTVKDNKTLSSLACL